MELQQPNQGIYRQIAEFGIEQVLSKTWADGERIPSVRQLAAEVGVNPNTVMNAYDYLKTLNIIETKRGLGFFVLPDGRQAAVSIRRQAFIEEELPKLRRNLALLDISHEDLFELLATTNNKS
ncbi:MAG: GntR family transcriptional regulator [Bacteroidota bacterium]